MSWHPSALHRCAADRPVSRSDFRHEPSRWLVTLVGMTTLVSASTWSGIAQAQAQGEPLEEVIVTGTSIRRVADEGVLPVQQFSQKDIVASGATSVTDFIQNIPAMQGFTSLGESVGGGGGGITSASLHDIGDEYTLVLLNGRRVAPATSGTVIDLNSIPLAAIERIDVLTDGASALYGADAIAGVVNFILKQGEAPLELNMHVSKPQHGGAEEANFSLSKGFGNLRDDGYQAFFAVSYDRKNELAAKEREFARTGVITGRQGNLNYDFFSGSPVSVPANVEVYFNTLDTEYFNPYLMANGTCSSSRAAHVRVGGECWLDYVSTIEISPKVERKAIYGSGKLALGESEWNLFGDLAYTDVSTLTRIAPYAGYFQLSTSSPLYSTYVEPYLSPTQQADVDQVWVNYRLYDLGNRTEDFTTQSLHAVGGIEGKIGNWTMSAAATVSNQEWREDYVEGWPLADKFYALMDSGFDPFSDAPLSSSEQQALSDTQYVGNYNKTRIGMRAIDFNLQGEVFDLPGGAFVTSFGGDWRKTGYKETPSEVATEALILFDSGATPYDLSRSSMGAYAEVLAPVAESVDLTAAMRYDRITGVDDDATGMRFGDTESATTFKIGGKWQPSRMFALRGSYGTGFRTASMLEIAQPKAAFGVTGNRYNCPFNSSYDPLGYIAAGYICPNGERYDLFTAGNASLKPEKSRQWNIGVVVEPIPDFLIGVNHWSVKIKDAVQNISERLILSDPARYLDFYTTQQYGTQTFVAILQTPVNVGQTEVEGIDWDLTYRHHFGFGDLTGKLAGTYLLKSRYTVPGAENEWTSSLNKFGVDDEVSFRNIITASLTLATGGWEHRIQGNYRNGYTDVPYDEDDCVFTNDDGDCTAGALHVPSYYTFDWATSYTFEGTTLTFGIRNLFDQEPPLSLRQNGGHQLGYDPRYASAELRTFVLRASIKY